MCLRVGRLVDRALQRKRARQHLVQLHELSVTHGVTEVDRLTAHDSEETAEQRRRTLRLIFATSASSSCAFPMQFWPCALACHTLVAQADSRGSRDGRVQLRENRARALVCGRAGNAASAPDGDQSARDASQRNREPSAFNNSRCPRRANNAAWRKFFELHCLFAIAIA